ncbi:npr-3 [Pristionchus pacificus]|uniref:Npr-3 n=1 Tax=Pristionchus pacificus TaxID=54126 RepID=A0A2A6BYG5_PRIPA|nr:npr-3 [Pristionchus pacificus]|eukprot:PDM70950.1 npr-3 [Pristionchus pacificus]
MINYSRAIKIVLFIWILGYSLALPLGIFSEAVKYENYCGEFCEENWPDYSNDTGYSRLRRMYGFAVLILQFAFPVIISSMCYIAISRVMNEQIIRRRGQQLLPSAERRLRDKKNRANRMMVYMVGGLLIAWMPLNLVNLYRDFFDITSFGPWYSTVFAFSHVIAMMSGVVNPVIYSWFNPSFRSAIQNLIRRCVGGPLEMRRDSEVRPLKHQIIIVALDKNGVTNEESL